MLRKPENTALKTDYISPFADLFCAASDGTIDDVRFFVEKKGVDASIKNEDGMTPLHMAAVNNSNVDVLEYLVSNGADINVKTDEDGFTPTFFALRNPSVEILEYLVSQGFDVHARDEDGITSLHYAAMVNSNVEILEYLVSQGVVVDSRAKTRETPLHFAASGNSKLAILEYLVSEGADVNAKTASGSTALHLAAGAEFHNADILQYLLSHGADANAMDADGNFPVNLANSKEKQDILLKGQGIIFEGAATYRVNALNNYSGQLTLTQGVLTFCPTGLDALTAGAMGHRWSAPLEKCVSIAKINILWVVPALRLTLQGGATIEFTVWMGMRDTWYEKIQKAIVSWKART